MDCHYSNDGGNWWLFTNFGELRIKKIWRKAKEAEDKWDWETLEKLTKEMAGVSPEEEKKLLERSKKRFIFLKFDLNVIPLKMIKVKAERFQMGSPQNELGRDDDEKQHWVMLTKDYWLGETEVMQGLWKAVMGSNPSYSKGDDYPVEKVSWYDAMEFCDKLNRKYGGKLPSGYKFSLPTEAQWEYACRAGTTTALNSGKKLTSEYGLCPNLDEVGWYGGNSHISAHPVAQKRRNALGFYDMHGNVSEWCSDWYGNYNGDATDPQGPRNGSDRVCRGGSWLSDARECRAADRGLILPSLRFSDLGFRLALVPVQ